MYFEFYCNIKTPFLVYLHLLVALTKLLSINVTLVFLKFNVFYIHIQRVYESI